MVEVPEGEIEGERLGRTKRNETRCITAYTHTHTHGKLSKPDDETSANSRHQERERREGCEKAERLREEAGPGTLLVSEGKSKIDRRHGRSDGVGDDRERDG